MGPGFAPRKDTAGQGSFLWVHVPCGMWLRRKEACLHSSGLGQWTLNEVKRRAGSADGQTLATFLTPSLDEVGSYLPASLQGLLGWTGLWEV